MPIVSPISDFKQIQWFTAIKKQLTAVSFLAQSKLISLIQAVHMDRRRGKKKLTLALQPLQISCIYEWHVSPCI
jgi:hypothetical protein